MVGDRPQYFSRVKDAFDAASVRYDVALTKKAKKARGIEGLWSKLDPLFAGSTAAYWASRLAAALLRHNTATTLLVVRSRLHVIRRHAKTPSSHSEML